MQEFKCPLCKNQYSQDNPPRLLIMCGHTFCHSCIKANIYNQNYKYQITCPFDKLNIAIDSNTPSHFPRNMAIIELISFYRRQKQQKAQKKCVNFQNLNQYNDEKGSGQKQQLVYQNKKRLNKEIQPQIDLLSKNQQDLCLLHQKPLDIICIQQKCTICAECALFGIHKGHKFTTMKQLLNKQSVFESSIESIIKQKGQINQKIQNGQLQNQILQILDKKRQLLIYQLSNVTKQMIMQIMKFQQEQKVKIQQKINQMRIKFKQQLKNSFKSNYNYQFWLKNIQSLTKCENKDIQLLIRISECCNKSTSDIQKGKSLVLSIKKQMMDFWNKLQQNIENVKITTQQSIDQFLKNNVKIIYYQEKASNSIIDHIQSKIWPQINISAIQESSLIDYNVNDFKTDLKLIGNQHSYEGSTHLSEIFKNLQQESKVQLSKPILRKPKNKDLIIHSTLLNLKDKISPFKSPKGKLKGQFSTTKLISSPMFKNKLKKYALKVKESEKFIKIVEGLQNNSLDIIDMTGYQIGDQIARQICIKILDSNKVKMLKLMKNQLTDICIKEIVEVLKIVDYLNLAQNSFTEKIIDSLLIFSSKNNINKSKSIQLGQNQIYSRRLKEKLQELKRYRITITL